MGPQGGCRRNTARCALREWLTSWSPFAEGSSGSKHARASVQPLPRETTSLSRDDDLVARAVALHTGCVFGRFYALEMATFDRDEHGVWSMTLDESDGHERNAVYDEATVRYLTTLDPAFA